MGTADDLRLRLYETMVRIQACDERFRAMVSGGQFKMMYFSPRGQEAIAAGVMAALEPDDYLVTIYRGLHDQIAKGVPIRRIMAEYLGRAAGPSKGKGGPMHLTDVERGVMLTTAVVGSGLPIANGLALASVLKGDGRVTIATFGDGASNIGAFHEALNMAAVWCLPVVFVCQNNEYGEHTPRREAQKIESIASRADAYGMAGDRVDGCDAVAVHEAATAAVHRARAGEGPTLLQADGFRGFGHYFGSNTSYVTEEEKAEARRREPVANLRTRLLADGTTTEKVLDAIAIRATEEVEDAYAYATALPEPGPEELLRDVYAEEVAVR